MLHYANHEFHGDDHEEVIALECEIRPRKKDYTRGRAITAQRRRASRKARGVECGMASRRNKRLTW